MPEITKGKETKTGPNGEVLEYEYWRSSFTDGDGKRHFIRLGNVEVVSFNEAKQGLIAKLKADEKPTAEAITVKEWCEGLVADMDLEQSTRNQYLCAIRQAGECWGEHKRLRQVTANDVNKLVKYIREHPVRPETDEAGHVIPGQRVSDWTIRNRCVSLSSLFERAKVHPTREKPYLHDNPFDDGEIPNPKDVPEYTHIDVAATWRLIEGCRNANERALVALTRLMAMRFEEAMHVEPMHINWQLHATVVTLRDNRIGKGRSTKQAKRLVPMSKAAYRLILDRFEQLPEGFEGKLIDREPLSRGAQGRPARHMRKLQESVGILNLENPFHDLRASQAQDWSDLYGCENSAEWCGHSIHVALKHYRANKKRNLGLVTGLNDPREELRKAYQEFDAKVVATTF